MLVADEKALERVAGRPTSMASDRWQQLAAIQLDMFDDQVRRDPALRQLVPVIDNATWFGPGGPGGSGGWDTVGRGGSGGLQAEYHVLRAEYEADVLLRAHRAAGVYSKLTDANRERLENLEYYLESRDYQADHLRREHPASVENLRPELHRLRDAAEQQKQQERDLANVAEQLRQLDHQAWRRPYADQIAKQQAAVAEAHRAQIEAGRKGLALSNWLAAGGRADEFETAWPEIFKQLLERVMNYEP
jgi:hypothetical protein